MTTSPSSSPACRPGERRYEKLFNDHEKVWKTAHPKILMAANSDRGACEGDEVLKLVSSFNGRISTTQESELRTTLKEVLAVAHGRSAGSPRR